ncbi:MAG: dockerin type I repeat-containing protein [Phycisphaerae bacterium]|nr:dockerin type I repeat-containing protein [Phycisphaerae bacterium]
MRRGNLVLLALMTGALTPSALAQFGTPGSTNVKEKIVGKLLSAEGAPTPAASDQIGVFFKNSLVGAFTFADSQTDFTLTIFGDNPSTTAIEGPKAGEKVEFRFYDASANVTRTDVRVENLQGEAFNYRYAGEENLIPDGLPIPIDLTPTRNLNLRVGAAQSGGGGSGNDRAKYDVDGNGTIDEADAAMVLRMVIGARRGLTDDQLEAADVNGDSKVDTNDAIAVMQNRK